VNGKGLKSITIPPTVVSIDSEAFYECTQLQSLEIPASVINIGPDAFYNCFSLSSVVISNSVTTISMNAFFGCTGLTSLSIPSSVNRIEATAFFGCKNLTSIVANGYTPIDLTRSTSVFYDINKETCKLYVPFGSSKLYADAAEWKEFTNIVEMPGFTLSANTESLKPSQVTAIVEITSDVSWTASSDQSWLLVSPASGTGNHTITFTNDSNTPVDGQSAIVTFSATDVPSKIISVILEGMPKLINQTAGTLSSELTGDELKGITNLTITGTIDARDFKTMRDQMPILSVLDLSGATITAYSGSEGPAIYDTEYPANQIPTDAFFDGNTMRGKTLLATVELPSSVNSIGHYSFKNCTVLTGINIPSLVSSIGYEAFSGCKSMTSITIPSTITLIEYGLFSNCSGLTRIDIPSTVASIGDGVFSGCTNLTSVNLPPGITIISNGLFSNCTGLTSIDIPSSVTFIDSDAFYGCINLTSISIPSSVTSINDGAFSNCIGLKSIFANPSVPPDLTYSYSVFYKIDKTICTLNVPFDSKELYAKAIRWADFINVVEMPELKLSETTANIEALQGSIARVEITSDVTWNASCDQAWLSVNPVSGTGSNTLAFIADANPAATTRTAIVTLNAPGVGSKTIVITQQTLTVGLIETELNITQLKCFPNPFTQEVTVEILNPKQERITLDIYNLAGQLIKNLLIGNTTEQLNLHWNGTNEGGQQVPHGMYICKVNNQSRQLIFERQKGSK